MLKDSTVPWSAPALAFFDFGCLLDVLVISVFTVRRDNYPRNMLLRNSDHVPNKRIVGEEEDLRPGTNKCHEKCAQNQCDVCLHATLSLKNAVAAVAEEVLGEKLNEAGEKKESG